MIQSRATGSAAPAETWEEAVLWLRCQEDQQSLVRACYYEDPLEAAAERFCASEEWVGTQAILAPYLPGRVLDIGAGRGIASYAFAKLGCEVVALEPDGSNIVGRGAIRQLAAAAGQPISAVAGFGESIPAKDGSFDIVYGRAVMHHAQDLTAFCREATRVLKRGGVFLATREHVITRRKDLDAFFAGHALHARYGGENAFLLKEYVQAIESGPLQMIRTFGPYDSAANYFPMTTRERDEWLAGVAGRLVTRPLAKLAMSIPGVATLAANLISQLSNAPGRHFAFLAQRLR